MKRKRKVKSQLAHCQRDDPYAVRSDKWVTTRHGRPCLTVIGAGIQRTIIEHSKISKYSPIMGCDVTGYLLMISRARPTNRHAPCGFDVENEHASSRIAQGSIADLQSVGRNLLYSFSASDPSRGRPLGTLVVVVTCHQVGKGGTTDGLRDPCATRTAIWTRTSVAGRRAEAILTGRVIHTARHWGADCRVRFPYVANRRRRDHMLTEVSPQMDAL